MKKGKWRLFKNIGIEGGTDLPGEKLREKNCWQGWGLIPDRRERRGFLQKGKA